MLEVTRIEDSTAAAQILTAAIRTVHSRIVASLTARAQASERYAALRNRARTQAAHDLIARIRDDIEQLEARENKRAYKRRATSQAKLTNAIERVVGDLLRVRAGTMAPSNVYRVVGRSEFGDAGVKYDMFTQVLNGLKTLGFVFHLKGQSRYQKTPFGNLPLPGQAARFWATSKLMRLAAAYGIDGANVGDHFAPEPPKNPLVLKDYAIGKGKDRESGRRIKYKNTSLDTPEVICFNFSRHGANHIVRRQSLSTAISTRGLMRGGVGVRQGDDRREAQGCAGPRAAAAREMRGPQVLRRARRRPGACGPCARTPSQCRRTAKLATRRSGTPCRARLCHTERSSLFCVCGRVHVG